MISSYALSSSKSRSKSSLVLELPRRKSSAKFNTCVRILSAVCKSCFLSISSSRPCIVLQLWLFVRTISSNLAFVLSSSCTNLESVSDFNRLNSSTFSCLRSLISFLMPLSKASPSLDNNQVQRCTSFFGILKKNDSINSPMRIVKGTFCAIHCPAGLNTSPIINTPSLIHPAKVSGTYKVLQHILSKC